MTAREKLVAWVEEQARAGRNRTQLAAEIGCSESALSRWLSGERGVAGRNATALERITGGRIAAAEWYAEDAA